MKINFKIDLLKNGKMTIGKNTPVTRLEIQLARELEFHEEIKQILAHDLRSPVNIMANYIGEIRKKLEEVKKTEGNIDAEQKLRGYEMIVRQYFEPIISSGRRVVDTTMILDLSNWTYEELSREAEEISPLGKINEVLDVWMHDAIRKGKGLNLHYRNQDIDKRIIAHLGAFSSIFSNLIGNAIQYANVQSNINARLTLEDNPVFEIENQITGEINTSELNELLKKGYRRERIKIEDAFVRNEGIGLYFVNKVVRQGFLGSLSIRSDYKQRISPILLEEYKVKNYSTNYPELKKSPFFYARVKLPVVIKN